MPWFSRLPWEGSDLSRVSAVSESWVRTDAMSSADTRSSHPVADVGSSVDELAALLVSRQVLPAM